MSKGILLIAINGYGNDFYYQLAYNLALSIRAVSKTPISILTDDVSLKHIDDKGVFDKIIEAKEEHYLEAYKVNPFLLKTFIYDYSPYKETIYLDADGLWVSEKTPDNIFEDLKDVNIQFHEVRRYTKEQAGESGMIWTKPDKHGENLFPKQWEAYQLKDAIYPEYNSSFIYFKKNKETKKYFDKAKAMYNDRRVGWKDLGGSYPDEMAWNLASATMGFYGKENYKPLYLNWEVDKGVDLEFIRKNFYVLSMASGYQPSKQLVWYNNLVKPLRGGNFNFNMSQKIFFRK